MLKNEILEELWKLKDQIAQENNYDIDSLARNLKEKQMYKKHRGIDLSQREKAAV